MSKKYELGVIDRVAIQTKFRAARAAANLRKSGADADKGIIYTFRISGGVLDSDYVKELAGEHGLEFEEFENGGECDFKLTCRVATG